VSPANCCAILAGSYIDASISPVPEAVAHFTPVASAESAMRTCPFVPTASREAVFAPVPTARSHLASHIVSVATEPLPRVSILS
jgi:hypothetical protein